MMFNNFFALFTPELTYSIIHYLRDFGLISLIKLLFFGVCVCVCVSIKCF